MLRWCCAAIPLVLASAVCAMPADVGHGRGGPRIPVPKPAPFGGAFVAQPPGVVPIPSDPADGRHPPAIPRPLRPAAPSPVGPGKLDRNGDPMPPGAIARFGNIRLRHGLEPIALHFTPDGKQLLSISGTADGIRLWDAATGKETARLELPIEMAAVAPDGQIVLVEGVRGRIWSPALKTVRPLPPEAIPESPTVLAVAPDSRTFAVGTVGKVFLRDLQNGQPRGELKLPVELPVMRLAFSPDGRWLAGMGPNKTGIWLWDVKALKRIRTYPFASDFADFTFSANGDRIAIAGASLCVFPTDSEELLEGFAPPEGQFFAPRFSPDGKSVFAANADASAVVFDAATGAEKDTFAAPEETLRAPVTLSPDGQTAAATDPSGGIRIWKPKTGDGPTADRLPTLFDPGFSADGKTVSVHDEKNQIRIFDAATGVPGSVTDLKIGDAFPIVYDARTGRLAAAVGADAFEVHIIDVKTAKVLAKLPASEMAMPMAAFDPSDPDRIAVFHLGAVSIYSLKSDRPLRTLDVGQRENQPNGCFSPDGRLLAVTTMPPSVWELSTGKKRCEVDGLTDPMGAAFSPDGRLLAVWDVNDVVVVFDVRAGMPLRRFQLPSADGSLSTAMFTPDSRRLVTGGRDGLITFWDVASGEPVLNLDRHDGMVTGLNFSNDGTRLVSTATDGTALVWDLTAPAARTESAAVTGPDEAVKLLGAADATEAYRGMKYFAGRPAEAAQLLDERLPVPKGTTPEAIAKLVADLGHDDFQTRRAAVAKLLDIGSEAVPSVRDAASNSPNPEVRKLAEEVLMKLDGPPTRPEDLRAIRAVEVLEALRRPDAVAVLKKWAAGPAGHRQTIEAAAALKRLAAANR